MAIIRKRCRGTLFFHYVYQLHFPVKKEYPPSNEAKKGGNYIQ